MKNLILKLDDDDYLRLRWVAEKLGIGVTETLRALIPSIEPPKENIIDENEISTAKFNDRVRVRELSGREKREFRGLLNELLEKGWAVTLAREIRQQLLDKEGSCIIVSTYKRLSRWVNPNRLTERERFVRERAEKISKLLFGREIERVD